MQTEKLFVAELTSEESRQFLTDEAVILLPMGSLEDQGSHAPMGDYLAAEAVTLDIARAARREGVPTFVMPVLPFGGRDFFASTHGGVAIRHSTLVALLEDILGSLLRHDLRKLMIVNGHGGNVAAIREVVQDFRASHDVFITSMYLWQVSYGLLPGIVGKETAAKVAGHGADPVTSVQMHYYPDLVRDDMRHPPRKTDRIKGVEVAGIGSLRYEGALFLAPVDALECAPTGVPDGDPFLCSAETGKALAERLAEIGAGFIRDHVSKGFAG